ncbi:MAG TPA: glucose 1-dehydrogenase [Pyrinomonadaceae bacterium]|nr:glucose 1-dehydrogenase [Pyrinomonadaceae bacterium]
MLLEKKTAIVTGAGSGIGRAVALAYAREGARVLVSDLDEQGGEETVRLIAQARRGAESFFVRADVSSPQDNEALAVAAVERFGALHVACNNAGIGGEHNEVAEYSLEGWRKIIDINLSGVFYGMRAQIPRILEAGGGAVVNMASILGQVGDVKIAGYVAAKHGVVGLTKVAALEYGARGVRVNAVGPGYIETPLINSLEREQLQALAARHPIGRLGRAEEVAELVLWLSSDRAAFVTGAYYAVDGGFLAQ